MIKTAKARGFAFRHSGFEIDLSFVIRISSFEMTRDPFRTTCEPCKASLYENPRVQTGRYRSGQTGQTVNLLALRLRWFESSPAQIPLSRQAVACAVLSAPFVQQCSTISAETADSTTLLPRLLA